ncbi:MAG: dTDP-4-dehydrorhamnose reductase [Lachnospiraceae bacterium]|jgi:dTDP-4-dehydrorhamnose reductase|nr:dTDP-4-dehydrorhamnose reductase [Lachnospiraceae bacterium]
MKILVTGVTGQLGYDCVRELKERNIEYVAPTSKEMDITDEVSVLNWVTKSKVDGVIHCAAYTAVDMAETHEELCRKINYEGTKNVASACRANNIKMIYISTDYVFDGTGEKPREIYDKPNPINVYGMTKLQGEEAVKELLEKYFIVRISWVFGVNGKNFIRTMLDVARNHDTLTVVDDQFGSPTFTYDLSKLLVDMIGTKKYGIYHATNEGTTTWYEFAKEIFKLKNNKTNVLPVSTEKYYSRAKSVIANRPRNSRLDKSRLSEMGFKPLPSWQDALKRYLKMLDSIDL